MKDKKTVMMVGGAILLLVALFWGCATLNQGGIGTSSSSNLFYANTSKATPVFEPSSTQSWGVRASATTTPESITGTPLYSVYYTLREFVSPRDEGVVDRSNLYKLLIDVDTVYSGLGSLESITEQSITPPFSQLPAVVCDSIINDEAGKKAGARKETTEEVKAIITWIWTEEANAQKAEYGLATIDYNKLTKDITVEMTYSVDYNTATPTTEYNLRCSVSGNTDANSFQFKYIIGDQKIAAKGVSSGEANYMLFKYTSGEATYYIVVPAQASEDFFIAQNSNPTQIYTNEATLPSSVEAYKTWVVNTPFFSSSNLVTDISTLNRGTTREGTIYLNYQ